MDLKRFIPIMRYLVALIALICLFSAASIESAEEPTPQIRALLEKAIKAQGGQEVMQKLLVATWKGRGIAYRKDNSGGTAFYGEWTAELPEKYRYKYDFKGAQGTLPVITVINGQKAWRGFGDRRGSDDLEEKRLKEELEDVHSLYVSRLVPLLQGECQLTSMPIGKRDGRYVLALKVDKQDRRTNRLYFDRQLGMLTYMERSVFDVEQKKDVIQETRFEHFQPMAGALLPQSITVKRDGKLFMELEISKVELLPSVDEKLFLKPPEPKSP